MPTYPLNRDNAWKAWAKGKVKGVNVAVDGIFADQSVQVQDTRTGKVSSMVLKKRMLANQALSQGMNSVRLWLSGWAGLCDIQPADWDNVGEAGRTAPAGSSGWDSKVPLTSSFDKSMATPADYAAQITEFLNQCERLGLGVILTGNYFYHQQGTEVRNLWGEPGNYAREHLGLFWVEVLKKWGRHKAVIGLDILNEPGPSRPSAGYGPTAWREDPIGWPTLAQDVVNKIRAAEAKLQLTSNPMPIIVELGGDEASVRMFDPYTPGAGGDIIHDPAERIVYSFHHYSPWSITCQGLSGDNWANLGRVYGKSVSRSVGGGFDGVYDIQTSITDGWGRAKQIVKNEQSLEYLWRHLINFRDNAAAAGHPVALYVGEFAHIQPDIDMVEPIDPGRSYLIDPTNGVPAFRVAEGSESYRHPVFSLKHLTGGWKKQNPSRWVTRFEPFTASNGQKKIRLYFDNLDRLLFGRTLFEGLTASELGSLANHIVEGSIGGGSMTIDPLVPSPRPDAILEKICKRDPLTGQLLKDEIDRSKVPLRYRSAMGFPINTKLAEPDDERPDRNALEWPMEKFVNTVLLDVVGPEGDIIKGAKVTIALDQFWIEVDASVIKVPAYLQAIDIDPNMIDNQYFPAKAVAVFSSATPNAEMEAGRDQFIADTLAVCRRQGISWSFLDACANSIGPIGWRASAASMRRFKADCER